MQINYTTGYAGTGKSTRLLELIDTLPSSSVVLAPTHKALARLRDATDASIELKTIHSLLGWIPSINEDATHINHIDTTVKLDREIDEYTDIVIDEAGMMSEEMLASIVAKLEDINNFETEHITMHLFLDPYQLLPVKGTQIHTDPLTTTNLTTQHRAESPDVVAMFTKFVQYLEGSNTSDLTTPPSENVLHVENQSIEDFQLGDRLLAYTNEAVGRYNTKIAAKLGITGYVGEEVQLGNMLELAKVDQFITPDLDDLLHYYGNNSLKLQNSGINKKFLGSSLKALLTTDGIEFISSNGRIIPVVVGIGEAYKIRQKAKEKAIENKKNFPAVYALNRAFTLDHAFASTVHKAQGSEFDRVFVAKTDIQKSIFGGSHKTYARLMYVSISRAKKKVFMLI